MTSAETSTSTDISTLRLPELKALAQQLGLKSLSGKRKGELVALINSARGTSGPSKSQAPAAQKNPSVDGAGADSQGDADTGRRSRRVSRGAGAPDQQTLDSAVIGAEQGSGQAQDGGAQHGTAQHGDDYRGGNKGGDRDKNRSNRDNRNDRGDRDNNGGGNNNDGDRGNRDNNRDHNGGGNNDGDDQQGRGNNRNRNRNRNRNNNDRNNNDRNNGGGNNNRGNDSDDNGGGNNNSGNNSGGGNNNRGNNRDNRDDEGGRGRRGRRRRDRGRNRNDGDSGEIREGDVLQPVAGILDVLDNYAFVRTSGYLAGQNDVYVSINMVRKNGLRRGDAVVGAVRMPRDGENNQRQKFNPLVRVDSINGGTVEEAKARPDFGKLTPLYPNQRLRLETEKTKLSTRVIDLVMPIGKGQRALIVSPPKAGKTTILQNIANAIAHNNPECHLMVVLVDERPEEVTDMQRSVEGEVIASTFDRPPSDHTQVAELAIERAKRLVEAGQDVVVLLDSITRLGRAYNNSSPASGRILSGGVDSTALYPPKRFLGAARNIEFGGSLTIIATAMVETGSAGDNVIFEEFKGTGNAELKLDRRISERRVFPAVDVGPSGTRKEELLMSNEEAQIMHKLRRVLSGLDSQQAIDLLMSQLRKTQNNYEFLLQVSKTTPTLPQDEE
ncbi:MAG TPA: transcription termination factor Rho [Dietzia timorensis]|uniref:Transcription termination factor Rho n=1 Tax=Dietzia timorensis TaxID=499555 RepID=A0A921K041_9ACTN|nr:transcription termination factor Rho [Dietzia timorensis]HJE91626.1 transcription termination factor Rho [Dietzia timorensis]